MIYSAFQVGIAAAAVCALPVLALLSLAQIAPSPVSYTHLTLPTTPYV